MKYLLDTNTCVHFLRYGARSPVAARLASVKPGDVVLSTVVVAELLFGALRSRHVAKSVAEVRLFAGGFQSLPFDEQGAEQYAKVRADLATKETPIGPNDLLIAATALANSLILTTHNTKEFI